MTDYVIDASSILVFAFGEPGADIVTTLAAGDENRLLLSSVNLAEVMAKMSDRGIPVEVVPQILAPLSLEDVPMDHALACRSAALRSVTRSAGLSLGDRCSLALGQSLGVPVLTADRNWLAIAQDAGIQIILTRPERVPH
jgi:PIN domain nuclease of toxin-antitoxin system